MSGACCRCVSRAFSLLEIVIVVIIMGILAALVVPQFAGATDGARTASLESSVSSVRSSIASFRGRAIIAGTDPYPTLQQLTTAGVVVQGSIPANPYSKIAEVQAVTQQQAEARAVVNADLYGWNYYVNNASDPPVAIFYANSSAATTSPDGQGGFRNANEL